METEGVRFEKDGDPWVWVEGGSQQFGKKYGTVKVSNVTATFMVGENYLGALLYLQKGGKESPFGGTPANITVTGTYICGYTPDLSNCANNTPERTVEGWSQWKVDEWFRPYIDEKCGIHKEAWVCASDRAIAPMIELDKDLAISSAANCAINEQCSPHPFDYDDVVPKKDGPNDMAIYLAYSSNHEL